MVIGDASFGKPAAWFGRVLSPRPQRGGTKLRAASSLQRPQSTAWAGSSQGARTRPHRARGRLPPPSRPSAPRRDRPPSSPAGASAAAGCHAAGPALPGDGLLRRRIRRTFRWRRPNVSEHQPHAERTQHLEQLARRWRPSGCLRCGQPVSGRRPASRPALPAPPSPFSGEDSSGSR